MFQLLPVQLPHCALREIHCCCGPQPTLLSIREPELQPPLPKPLFWGTATWPATGMRRKGQACETAHWVVPPAAPVAKFSTARQKFCVALLLLRNASERMVATDTWSGDWPRPRTSV